MGGDVRTWSWRDDGLCWREAGMGLDVHDGDFLVVGRVFSLLSVSPLLWPDPFLVMGNARGRAEALACYRSLRRMDGMRVAKGPSLPLVIIKPCRAFGRFDNDSARGRRFPPWRRCHGVFSYPHKSPGENLVTIYGRAAAALRVVSSLGASLRRSSNASITVDGPFREAAPSWGPLHSCGGRHALRLFLLMKSKLLADGGAATLGNDDMLQSLPWSSGAGRVKEVAPRWLG
uniref:Uncharacterized protein n=1 Tax=Oryza glumipatula TaxID=40148 RepID=A0A0D9ZBH0_9ORYZ